MINDRDKIAGGDFKDVNIVRPSKRKQSPNTISLTVLVRDGRYHIESHTGDTATLGDYAVFLGLLEIEVKKMVVRIEEVVDDQNNQKH